MNCPCDFDICEAVNIVIWASVVSATLAIISKWLSRRRNRKKYGKIDGLFNGTSAGHLSRASVYYISRNMLEISVTEENEDIWIGFISLYNEKNGIIDWNYFLREEKLQRFGIKKIIITNKDNFKIIGDLESGFGIENFKRLPIEQEKTGARIKRLLKYYFDI